ncbi:MAG: glycosyltransferase family 4 protein [Acidimicrobiales bacterium]
MKVLYVIDSLANGGAERSLAAMAPLYGRHGIDLEVVVLQERAGVHAEVAAVVPVSVLTSATRRGRAVELRSLVAGRRPDVVHSTLFEADLVSRVAVGPRGPALVCSLVNDSYSPAHLARAGVPAWKLRAVKAVDALTGRRVRRFHAISEHVAAAMQERLRIPAGRIEVVPRGRDPEVLGRRTPERRAAARLALGVPTGVPLVLAAARQEPQKGLDVLLDAWPSVIERVPAARLVVAGRDGAASAALLRRAAEVGAALLGDRPDVADLLVGADAFAFPSRWEGAGGALLEAMALETPVVTSDLPPARELLDGAAAFVPPEDPAALAGALVAVLTRRPDAAVADARQRFVDRYTVDAVVARMATFYRRALG